MNNLELIQDKQNIVFNILSNSFSHNKLAHAYLFTGAKGSLQDEMALLVAQTLVFERDGLWACGVCDQCLRIKEDKYPDFLILDGREQLIKKEAVISLQQKFSLTAFESASKKIFLIKDAHNMTSGAANALLKFLEEPSSDVVGILISDDIESMLPTIVSRCTTLTFKALSHKDAFELAIAEGMDRRDAYYYSRVVNKYYTKEEFLDQESYTLFKMSFEKYINALVQDSDRALFVIQNELLKHSNKAEMNEAVRMFLDMLIVFLNDLMSGVDVDEWYNDISSKYQKNLVYLDLLAIVLETKNKVSSYINLPLLMDQMMYKFREVL